MHQEVKHALVASKNLPNFQRNGNASMVLNYIVEHMEPELDEWSQLEYANIVKRVGRNRLYLTHVDPELLKRKAAHIGEGSGIVSSVKAVQELEEVEFSKVLLLDPSAPEPLAPEDAANYEWLLFGGILGDDPPQDRTQYLRKLGYARRHLGPVQMTTDTAVIVSKEVIENQIPLDKLAYVDRPEIKLGKKETAELPFRYLVNPETGEPQLPEGLIELLKKSNDISLV
ncbi:hypothetical protein HDU87_002364 [Geranomyces variabilis]|uniref:Uncharacterized protein n=1 Tax=Geranomyces variabilis TaxID=109894 RepID=A0AAD5TNF6_9FUNG|nr:hypothetical protein HDU87_002364 [Geranomyces variabilis]